MLFNVFFKRAKPGKAGQYTGDYEHESCVVIAGDVEAAIKKAKAAFPNFGSVYFAATRDTYAGVPRAESIVC